MACDDSQPQQGQNGNEEANPSNPQGEEQCTANTLRPNRHVGGILALPRLSEGFVVPLVRIPDGAGVAVPGLHMDVYQAFRLKNAPNQ